MRKPLLKRLLSPTVAKRLCFFLLADMLIIALSLYASFLARLDFGLDEEAKHLLTVSLPFFLIFKMGMLFFFGAYRFRWRYVGVGDLSNVVKAVIVAQSLLMVLILVPLPDFMREALPGFKGFPRSVFLIDMAVSLLLLIGIRASKRFYLEVVRKLRATAEGKRTVVIGAGNVGEMVIRDMARMDYSVFYPVALLDDDEMKVGTYVRGVKVVGKIDELGEVVNRTLARAVVVAVPSLSRERLRMIYEVSRASGIETLVMAPQIYRSAESPVPLRSLEEIKVEDLLGRQSVEVDYREIKRFLKGRTILITGAGGSIGAEICTQVCAFEPKELVFFEVDETELHNLELKLRRLYPELDGSMHFTVGDIRDIERVREVVLLFSPQVIFHAAAYKHVPMMEQNAKEAVKVNVFGTWNLAKCVMESGAERFIMISTDKAVKPVSVMGATKRFAELICESFNNQSSTEFISVRFGNVLSSRGSVLPIFLEQLKQGGPLTVTHPDMERYFMTIPEAVSLVLQAGAIGRGGQVMVLDMGEPVKILQLAEDLIRLHGLEPHKDIKIEFTGIRPGEKLTEELFTPSEKAHATKHGRVFVVQEDSSVSAEQLEEMLEALRLAIDTSSIDTSESLKQLLRRYTVSPPEKEEAQDSDSAGQTPS